MTSQSSRESIRILGIDPGLMRTGWGLLEMSGHHLKHLDNGVITTDSADSLAERLMQLHDGLTAIVADWNPNAAAVEETFVNKNPTSTLKLGQARAIALLVPALAGVKVAEYAPNHVKKAVVGAGHAGKAQIHAMVSMLLPGVKLNGADAADALALAICHAHQAGGQSQRRARIQPGDTHMIGRRNA
ncbi:MAG: crossover junction endodeoxyribonuclease RuvC [Pseudomonadota bacterium]